LFESYSIFCELDFQIKKLATNNRRLAERFIPREFPEVGYASATRPLTAHELSIYSQNGEDGILLYLFSRIGTTDRRFVEFGVQDGTECNTANLSINHGWSGLLIDGDEDNVKNGSSFYSMYLGNDRNKIRFVCKFVTAENINEIISASGITGEIDILSIDIDGVDYWVWKQIDCVSPRVVVIEYNASLGVDASVTIPYDPKFVWNSTSYPHLFFTGASLRALTTLGASKGYRLVGCDSQGVNAFFVRNDVAPDAVPALTVEEAYFPHALRTLRYGLDGQRAAVARLCFETVS